MRLQIELPDNILDIFQSSGLRKHPVAFDREVELYEDEGRIGGYVGECNNIHPFSLVVNGYTENDGANYLLIRAVLNAFREAALMQIGKPTGHKVA